MDAITHTLIAVGCMYATYLIGRWSVTKNTAEKAIGHTLDSLEKEGLILTRTDKKGEKDIIPVSEIIAKATRDAIK
tara:strand:- start:253 stop:480 length:228 start_codon:yes stop_codon:yes gene_type:complete